MTHPTRLNLLASIPTTALAGPVLAKGYEARGPLSNLETDPVLRHYRDWLAARKDWLALANLPDNGNWDHPQSIDARKREHIAFMAIIGATPTSLEGIAAVTHLLSDVLGLSGLKFEGSPEHLYEHQLITSLWKATTGEDGLPPS